MPHSPNSQGLGITLANSAHPPSPLRISTTSSETRDQAQSQVSAYGQRSPTKTRAGVGRLRVKTSDFMLQPTHSYTHSHSPTKPVTVVSTSPTQPTATATSPCHSPSLLDYRPAAPAADVATATTIGAGSGKGTVKSLRTSKPLGPRSSPRVGTCLSGRTGDHDHLDHLGSAYGESGHEGLRVEVEEMYTDEGEERQGEDGAKTHLAPFRAPSSASVISASFSASTHTSSSKSGKRKSEGLRRRGVAQEGGKYMQLEEDADADGDADGDADADEGGREESEEGGQEQRPTTYAQPFYTRHAVTDAPAPVFARSPGQARTSNLAYPFPYPPQRTMPPHLYTTPSFFDPRYTTPTTRPDLAEGGFMSSDGWEREFPPRVRAKTSQPSSSEAAWAIAV
ncbi:hypothetical protein I313_02332 [Cryptococcus deuterogattii Ram5]|uniref:Uncharacterized protein n=1 Tax=Cryptococcus deuterogattii Ram5 TaxID=1296110 RepID=A0A0D0V8N5_9TREE|nr:hypothetical protein I313_02332 [Cryptococcus deuterogattii Ram5]